MDMEINVPYGDVVAALEVFRRIVGARVRNGSTAMRIAMAQREIEERLEVLNEARQAIIEAHGVAVDADGRPTEDEDEVTGYKFIMLDDNGEQMLDDNGEQMVDRKAQITTNEEIKSLEVPISRYLREDDLDAINEALDEPLSAGEVSATAWLWDDLRKEWYEETK